MSRGRLPTFLGIGVPRSGTTWMYKCFEKHKNIYVNGKEIQYFVLDGFRSTYDKGLEWYKSLYDFEDEGLYMAWGEISPRYYLYPRTPKAIYDLIPNVKLIYSLRNPVEMLYSLYAYHCKMYPYTIDARAYSFMAFLNHHMVAHMGYYYKYLKAYLEYFNEEQVHIAFFEDLADDPAEHLRRICEFLGVKYDDNIGVIHCKGNKALIPTNYRRTIFLRYLAAKTGLSIFNRLDEKYNRIEYKLWEDRSIIGKDEFNRLVRIYRDDIKILSKYTGRNLSHWLNYESISPELRYP